MSHSAAAVSSELISPEPTAPGDQTGGAILIIKTSGVLRFTIAVTNLERSEKLWTEIMALSEPPPSEADEKARGG